MVWIMCACDPFEKSLNTASRFLVRVQIIVTSKVRLLLRVRTLGVRTPIPLAPALTAAKMSSGVSPTCWRRRKSWTRG